uniref:Diacylglycerol kinase n=1 Tax=Oryzias sinensis TaxID=183150 RepID=A0A8C7XU85_9TELE
MEDVYSYGRSPAWEELEPEKGPAAEIHTHAAGAVTGTGAVDESSDSEPEQDGPQKLIRKVSTSGQIRSKTSIKEGLLLKQTSSFQRWKKRYFKLRGRTLYYAKDAKSLIFDEVDLSDASVAESSTKNVNNSFTVITPFRRLILCAENRKEMEDWISSLKSVQSREHYEVRVTFQIQTMDVWDFFCLPALHVWFKIPHILCLCFSVCKFKAHKRCAVRATNNCKWTTLASIGKDIIEDEDGVAMPHQWLEGNLPVSAKCAVCEKTCGSVLKLQDWRCLWCKAMVHTACMDVYPRKCPLGQCKVSIIPPTALNSIDSDGRQNTHHTVIHDFGLKRLETSSTCPPSCASPLLVFVNSKSGDNQGVKFLRRFKQLLNPAQVFDLVNGGPHLGLRLFQKFDNFRILVCGGDGSVGWVLSEIDKLNLHKQCQLGVLPLGTGNDLARVLGWGPSCDDDTQLPQILEKLERASTKMLDRWSIMTYEIKIPPKHHCPTMPEGADGCQVLTGVIRSPLANTIQLMRASRQVEVVGKEEASEESFTELKEKLEEEETEKGGDHREPLLQLYKSREQLMLRANSLKKAVRQIIEQAVRGISGKRNPFKFFLTSKICFLDTGFTPRFLSKSRKPVNSFASLAVSPCREGYMEKCVMNNYFGIGLDAKISLEFNNKREEHPEKCRSRTKNMMWYGVLGTKELLQRTYKNLEQKVQLECDGQYIPLPSLQGIAVLNIPSYAGGTNFWGGTKEDDIFCAPSFDDKILEVVAVFGSMQMAMSRVIKLQHHRIAQCRTVKITILGDEGVPIQVDGEAWVQPPGVIKIQHKNRAQMLTRDRAFENTLKSWEDKLKYDKPPLRPHLYSQQSVDLATEEEATLVQSCARAAEELITRICEAAKTNGLLEQELAHAVNAASHAINKTHPKFPEVKMNVFIMFINTSLHYVIHVSSTFYFFLQQLDPPEEEQLSNALQSVEVELGKLGDVPWLYYILQPNDEEVTTIERKHTYQQLQMGVQRLPSRINNFNLVFCFSTRTEV